MSSHFQRFLTPPLPAPPSTPFHFWLTPLPPVRGNTKFEFDMIWDLSAKTQPQISIFTTPPLTQTPKNKSQGYIFVNIIDIRENR